LIDSCDFSSPPCLWIGYACDLENDFFSFPWSVSGFCVYLCLCLCPDREICFSLSSLLIASSPGTLNVT
jgi:hypothetical protein